MIADESDSQKNQPLAPKRAPEPPAVSTAEVRFVAEKPNDALSERVEVALQEQFRGYEQNADMNVLKDAMIHAYKEGLYE